MTLANIRRAFGAVGPLRQALLILAFTASLLTLWRTIDALNEIFTLPPQPNALAQMLTPEQFRWYDLKEEHDARVFRLWEHAAQKELAVIVGTVCLWLVLPKQRGAPPSM
jgi:hypothetical protein